MKISGPGGDGYKIPEPADNQGPKKAQQSQFDQKIGGTDDGKSAFSAKTTDGPQTQELRQVLKGVVGTDEKGMTEATDKIVDWVLQDAFGDGLTKQKGAENLRTAIREQLLADPNEAARLRRIIEQL